MHDEFQLSLCRDRCKGGTWRLHSTAVTSILLLAVLVAICFSDAVASLDSPCSLVNSSCFNASRCIQGFTFYIEPSKGMYNFETLSAAIAPTNVSLQHRCQRILQNPTSGEDNVETWAAECLVFVISEYFEVVDDPQDACLIVPSFDTSCTCSTCRSNPKGPLPWEISTAAALAGMLHWDGGRNHLILNWDHDDADPHIQHGSAIMMRSSWLQPQYRTKYDVQLPVVRSGMQLPHTLQHRLDTMHTVAAVRGQRHITGRACRQLEHSDSDMCESMSHTAAERTAFLQSSQPYPSPLLEKVRLDALMDDIIAARPTVGPYNASLLLYFRGPVYRYSPGYERRTLPLGQLILSLGAAVNTFSLTSSNNTIVIDGMCFGAWPEADTTNPALVKKLLMAPHCAGCKVFSRLLSDNTSEPCEAAPGLLTFKQGKAAARFMLTPWGIGAQTHLTMDAIMAGSVPVVVSDYMVAPYDREGRLGRLWDACLVRTLSSQITALPGILMAMTDGEYRRHLSACLLLLGEREVFVGASIMHGLCTVASRLADQLKKGEAWYGRASRWCEIQNMSDKHDL